MKTLEERFWSKVDKSGGPDACWIWTGARGWKGYGQIGIGRRGTGMASAHRVSFELHFGPIPSGLHVLHRCDSPPCVNPAHLWLGTHAENMADKMAKGRQDCGRLRGETNGRAKLCKNDVLEIRALRALGWTQRAIASRFDIHRTTVRAALRGHTWSHISAGVGKEG